jgi:hypothetical protein
VRGFAEFIERFIEAVLPLQDGPENKMQQRRIWRDMIRENMIRRVLPGENISGLLAQPVADLVLRGSEILLMNQGGDLRRWALTIARPACLRFSAEVSI